MLPSTFVSVSSSDKIETNCQLPLTLPPNEEDGGDQVSFWYRFSSNTSLERRPLMSHHPRLVQQVTYPFH